MYVSNDMVLRMAAKYGRPESAKFEFPLNEREYNMILKSKAKGRQHDFTIYPMRGDEVVVIAKHNYPPGLFRAMSGGIDPGEEFEVGIAREVSEELGCEIKLTKFLLISNVRFTFGNDYIDWTSYVFRADYIGGDFNFTDTHEIKAVRWAHLSEFAEFGRIMRATDVGGFQYRAALHERVEPLLIG